MSARAEAREPLEESTRRRLKRQVAHELRAIADLEGRPEKSSNSPTRELVQLAWPIAAAMLGETAIGLVDTKLVGGLGPGALGGVGIATTFMFLGYSVVFGLMRGVRVRAAHAIGMSATAFGRYQSISNLLSSAGNFALTMLLARGIRRGFLEVALLVCGITCAMLTTVNNQVVFAVALQLYNVSWYIVYPLLLGLAYTHDPHGRLAVRTTGTWLVAQSAGSLAAGFVAQVTKGYGLVGGLGMVTCAMAVVIVIRFQAGKRAEEALVPLPAH